jgi:lysine N6-hydroxylase
MRKKMDKQYDLIGVGIGPFNLSLAAILDKVDNFSFQFLEQKKSFNWHAEIMFSDSDMQTSFLKDLVTPVDPTSPYSFLNYLVQNGLFHAFMNTNRKTVMRREFEMYCQWVSEKLSHRLSFDTSASDIHFNGEHFEIKTSQGLFASKHLCVGTGLTPRIPECTKEFISPQFFHAKSPYLKDLDVSGKNVVVIGGGQTGVEIFRNVYKDVWGSAKSLKLITGRSSLLPLDESPFTNEFFTPGYVSAFFDIHPVKKTAIVKNQKMASDGNTPAYLEEIYRELYQMKFVDNYPTPVEIYPSRILNKVESRDGRYLLVLENQFQDSLEEVQADIVILCTGFSNDLPAALTGLKNRLNLDEEGRFILNESFKVNWDGPAENKIYALNFSRHSHGISEPQTSLMAWRSAMIANDVVGEKLYLKAPHAPNFMNYIK